MVLISQQGTTSFHRWCQATSAHGVIDWFRSHKLWISIAWLILLLFVFAITLWQVIAVIITYAGTPFNSRIYLETLSDGIDLPNITVCNQGRITQPGMDELGMTEDAASYFSQLFLAGVDDILKSSPAKWDQMKTAFDTWLGGATGQSYASHPRSLLQKLSFSCTDMMISCTGPSAMMFPGDDCCWEGLSTVNDYGVCHIIRPRAGHRKMPVAGAANAIKFLIDPRTDQYSKITYNDRLGEGIAVTLSEDPHTAFAEEPIFIRPGSFASLSVEAQIHEHKEHTYGLFTPQCTSTHTFKVLTKGNYTRNQCVYDCIFAAVEDYCSCTPVLEPAAKMKHCTPDDQRFCAEHIISDPGARASTNNSRLNDVMSAKGKCFETCDLEPCSKRTLFRAALSTSNFPPTNAKAVFDTELQSKGTTIAMIEQVISLQIYFPRLGYTHYETVEAQTLEQLIASIGGQFGLWMGISVVTLIQACTYIGIGCSECFRKMKKKNKVEKIPESREAVNSAAAYGNMEELNSFRKASF